MKSNDKWTQLNLTVTLINNQSNDETTALVDKSL